MRIPPASFLVLLLTGACTPIEGDYPTLLPRPIERVGIDEPVIAVPMPVVADPALDATIATLAARSVASEAEFQSGLATARRSASVAGAAGTESWVIAQLAVSAIDTARGASVVTLADLEAISISRAGAGNPPYPALERARTEAEARVMAQTGAIDTIKVALPGL